jgi:hypothetical protein
MAIVKILSTYEYEQPSKEGFFVGNYQNSDGFKTHRYGKSSKYVPL